MSCRKAARLLAGRTIPLSLGQRAGKQSAAVVVAVALGFRESGYQRVRHVGLQGRLTAPNQARQMAVVAA